nr:putative membrane protein [Cedratvirus lena]
MYLPNNVLFSIALFTDRPYTLSSCDQQMRSMLSSEGFWKEKFTQEGLELPLFSYFGAFSWSSAYYTSKKSMEAVRYFVQKFKPLTVLLWYIPDVRMLSFNNLPSSLASSYLTKAYKEYEIKNNLQSTRKFYRCYIKIEREEITFVLGQHKNKIKVDENEMCKFLFHVDFLNIQKLSEI